MATSTALPQNPSIQPTLVALQPTFHLPKRTAPEFLQQSPNGQTFTVDVKGQSTRNFWLVQRREPSSSHFFVLVSIPPEFEPPRYFILSSAELMKHRADYEAASKARGKYKDNLGGMNWSTALPHENQWNVLPK